MPICPACLGEFSPKLNHKAHKCDCGSLLRLTTDGWREHEAVHSLESEESERVDVPPGWKVDEWIGVGETKVIRHEVTATKAPICTRRNDQSYWVGKQFKEPVVIETEQSAEKKPIFGVAPRPFFEQKDPAIPLYRNPPREKIGKSGSDWNGSSPTRRYLEREK